MKLLASILIITLLATVAQTTAAQKLEMPPEFFQFGKIIAKGQKALDIIEKHCAMPKLKTVPKLSKTQSLGDHPVEKNISQTVNVNYDREVMRLKAPKQL